MGSNSEKQITKKWEIVHLDVLMNSNQKRIFKWNFLELCDEIREFSSAMVCIVSSSVEIYLFQLPKAKKKWEIAQLDVLTISNQKHIFKWNFLGFCYKINKYSSAMVRIM